MPGEPIPYVSCLSLSLNLEDGIELAKLPSGEARHGYIHTEIYPPPPEETRRETLQTGNAFFHKTTKYDTSLQEEPVKTKVSSPVLSLKDTHTFLRELLDCTVDEEATQRAYDKRESEQGFNDWYFREQSTMLWNRDNPGAIQSFFSQEI